MNLYDLYLLTALLSFISILFYSAYYENMSHGQRCGYYQFKHSIYLMRIVYNY